MAWQISTMNPTHTHTYLCCHPKHTYLCCHPTHTHTHICAATPHAYLYYPAHAHTCAAIPHTHRHILVLPPLPPPTHIPVLTTHIPVLPPPTHIPAQWAFRKLRDHRGLPLLPPAWYLLLDLSYVQNYSNNSSDMRSVSWSVIYSGIFVGMKSFFWSAIYSEILSFFWKNRNLVLRFGNTWVLTKCSILIFVRCSISGFFRSFPHTYLDLKNFIRLKL